MSSLDRDKLRTFVRTLLEEDLLILLDRAIDRLPTTTLAAFIHDYVDPETFKTDPGTPSGLLEATQRFHTDSLRRKYYEPFEVNWRNSEQKSRGTQIWIAECNRLVDLCVAAVKAGEHTTARKAFDLIFDLLNEIDQCEREILFFADEGGSWEAKIDWRTVLPVWFECLSATAAPREYAEAVRRSLQRFAFGLGGERLLDVARRVATEGQRAELDSDQE